MDIKVAFFPVARTTFFMPSAEEIFENSSCVLQKIFKNISKPDGLLTSPEMLEGFADTLSAQDLIIFQCTTFVGSEFISELTRRFNCPIVIWSVREPSIDGGRLKLNSLTGAFSAGNSIYMQGGQYEFVFGNPEEEEVTKKLFKIGKAVRMIKDLRNLTVGVVGSQPTGFGFGAENESELAGKFGIRIKRVEAADIMKKAASYSDEESLKYIEELKVRTQGGAVIPKENLNKYARLRRAYEDFASETKAKAIASRCWPDFFTGFGAPVCSVLSMLNDNGIPSSCETDIGGAISMFIGSGFTDSPTYFGDPVAVDEACGSIVYWHCGAGASSLARNNSAKLGVHPNRKIGPTMEFGLKEGKVTVLRLGKDKEGFRMYIMRGEALDEPQKFWGTSVTVKPDGGRASEKIALSVMDGWEPHFVVSYGDVREEIILMCKFLNIRVYEY